MDARTLCNNVGARPSFLVSEQHGMNRTGKHQKVSRTFFSLFFLLRRSVQETSEGLNRE